jgi:hypothetical protein
MLERMRELTVARINTEIHLPTISPLPLPPPPKQLELAGLLSDVHVFPAAAVDRQPDTTTGLPNPRPASPSGGRGWTRSATR